MSDANGADRALPGAFVPRIMLQAVQLFIRTEASSGILLLLAAVAALVWANSSGGDAYFDLWRHRIAVGPDALHIDEDLRHWLNDGLMTLFFLIVGLEIKRELVRGELSEPRRALLPAAAALGGMAAPALIYIAFNRSSSEVDGWGIPMATDIAFALGALSLLGGRVPFSVKVFLLALAIADDIGAILVIAVFYTASLDLQALAIAVGLLAGIVVLNRAGVRHLGVYLLAGLTLWLATFESGVHATLAGVALGLCLPDRPPTGAATDEEQPLDRLERRLHPWVSYGVVPLFALANAGIVVSGDIAREASASSVTLGVALGLLLGKPLGIFGASWLAVRLRLCELPNGAGWHHIAGVGLLGGIGFTVSLLIAGLAFGEGTATDYARLGVLGASVLAAAAGFGFLWLTSTTAEGSSGD